jgi:hypothetical protein
MIEVQHLNALRQICDRMSDARVDWVVTGSLGMALQGVDVRVHDIDIQSDSRGVYEIERIFREHVARPVRDSTSERVRSHLGALEIGGVTVEIFGGVCKRREDGTWEEPVDVVRHRRCLKSEGMLIPVLSLEFEYEAYQKLGRRDKAELIRRSIEQAQAATRAAG